MKDFVAKNEKIDVILSKFKILKMFLVDGFISYKKINDFFNDTICDFKEELTSDVFNRVLNRLESMGYDITKEIK